jgi:hypothetical protein
MTDPTDSGTRPIHLPPKKFGSLALEPTNLPAGIWFRIFNRPFDPIHFNNRPGNRFTPVDGKYKVLYVADQPRTCFLETFGDELYGGNNRIALSRWQSRSLAHLACPALRVCDLTSDPTLTRLGIEKGSLYATNLSVPQAWSKAIMEHPAGFQGIQYASRFCEGRCLAIFDDPEVVSGARELERCNLLGSSDGDYLVEQFEILLV